MDICSNTKLDTIGKFENIPNMAFIHIGILIKAHDNMLKSSRKHQSNNKPLREMTQLHQRPANRVIDINETN